MKNLVLFDDPALRANLLPFTFTRPVADLRVGILTIAEKWRNLSQATVSFLTQGYLQGKFGLPVTGSEDTVYVNGAVCPSAELLEQVQQLPVGHGLEFEGLLVALHAPAAEVPDIEALYRYAHEHTTRETDQSLVVVRQLWDIFKLNGDQIRVDFKLLTQGRTSQPITDEHTRVYNLGNIFIEEGAKIKAAILNADTGPIYIGKNAEVHEGSMIRGPFALGEESHVNVGGRMRGDITIGPFCKVGGEVNNCVFFGYSNKGHEGFLGNSVVGEWCNFGADTNASNLKNNYAPIKIWSHAQEKMIDTGLQFCGLMMADHVKCGINTMFNTGTVVGVGANIFGAGFPPTFVPSFTWGGADTMVTYRLPKFFEVAEAVLGRRGLALSSEDRKIFTQIFHLTQSGRPWDGLPV
ncbi:MULTISPECIES: GlmU family protein [Rufibacter]|uniref:UDP-N-acetylglucosamine diphosphorylase/glucosamine-1-phosphate N-acetyltransferase n=1 Tax=Rufibacter quisquiliarum TaxID=1549639 RepID=A0A839GD89_9BACT|nr:MULTISPECIES: GlmU family protein [Rufibacter]MBA9076872.1 UDP-N-acetylglucosamine diphosphorylase/glucosamine-1-phosphate N-acetyltransferase [Rufibacter quisquiliarum]